MLLVLSPFIEGHVIIPEPVWSNFSFNYPRVLGVLGLPLISQEGSLASLGSGPPPCFPRSTPAFGSTGRKKLCWGVGRKFCLGLECGPGYHWGHSPPLPGPEAQSPTKEASHPQTFPLSVPSQGWVAGTTQSPSGFSSRGGGGSHRPAAEERWRSQPPSYSLFSLHHLPP